MPRFAVQMFEDDGAWERLSERRRTSLMKRYVAWVGALKRKKAFVGGAPLGSPGVVLERKRGRVVASPYSDRTNVQTGWFVLDAKDLPAAVRLARSCPALLHGERVLVRPAAHADE